MWILLILGQNVINEKNINEGNSSITKNIKNVGV